MKKSLLFISMLIAGATSSVAQTIPNGDFEYFTSGRPNGWGTLGTLIAGSVAKATVAGDFNGGLSAIKLTTKSSGGNVYPGIAASKSNVTLAGVETGGFTCTSRPTSLEGFAKYLPVGSDTAIVSVIFTKWNGTSRDTIGSGSLEITVGYSTFGAFSVPVSFINFNNPDTCQIVLASSDTSGAVGSALYVDDLSFISPPPLACNLDPNIDITATSPQILPDTNTVMIQTPGGAFSKTFTIFMPLNAILSIQGNDIAADVDSVHIEDLTGIFSGFTKVCGTPNCMIKGGEVGCFTLTGTMPMTDNILYGLSVTLNPYGTITSVPPAFSLFITPPADIQTTLNAFGGSALLPPLATYKVQVGTPVISGIESFDLNGFDVSQNNPNPFDASTVINFTCPVSGKVNFAVTDVLGRQVYDTNINATAGANTFTFTTDLTSGTYFFSLSDGTHTITRKMIVTE